MKNQIFALAIMLLPFTSFADDVELEYTKVDGIFYDCIKGSSDTCIHDARWILYARTKNNHYLIDQEGIGRRNLWLIVNKIGKKESFMQLVNFDCDQFLYRIERASSYDDHFAKGRVTFSMENQWDWTTPKPNSVLEQIQKMNCHFAQNPQ